MILMNHGTRTSVQAPGAVSRYTRKDAYMNHDFRFFAVLTFVLARCTRAAGESDGVQETTGGSPASLLRGGQWVVEDLAGRE